VNSPEAGRIACRDARTSVVRRFADLPAQQTSQRLPPSIYPQLIIHVEPDV